MPDMDMWWQVHEIPLSRRTDSGTQPGLEYARSVDAHSADVFDTNYVREVIK